MSSILFLCLSSAFFLTVVTFLPRTYSLVRTHRKWQGALKTVYDRPTPEAEYNFSAEMLEAMINELSRLITKYSASPWNTKITANKAVALLTEHRTLIQEELDDVLV